MSFYSHTTFHMFTCISPAKWMGCSRRRRSTLCTLSSLPKPRTATDTPKYRPLSKAQLPWYRIWCDRSRQVRAHRGVRSTYLQRRLCSAVTGGVKLSTSSTCTRPSCRLLHNATICTFCSSIPIHSARRTRAFDSFLHCTRMKRRHASFVHATQCSMLAVKERRLGLQSRNFNVGQAHHYGRQRGQQPRPAVPPNTAR